MLVPPEVLIASKKWLRVNEQNPALLFELFPHNATMEIDDDFIDLFDDSDEEDYEEEDGGYESTYDGSIDLEDLDDFRNDLFD